MAAMKHWYATMKDKLWGPYGFYDAFSEHYNWFKPHYLAIDQGPIVVMMENYRTGLLWKLFTSCPEIKNGMKIPCGDDEDTDILKVIPSKQKARSPGPVKSGAAGHCVVEEMT